MSHLSLAAYVASVVVLFAKYLAISGLQGKARLGSKTFRWPEDAAAWGGAVAGGPEDETTERAQAVLRNDAETQPIYMALAGAWVALGAPPSLVVPAAATYALSRVAHAVFFVRPRQPLRNRAFVLGLAVLLGIAADALRRALAP